MFIFKRVHHIRQWVASQQKKGQRLGFVPTMGALHYGHISLVDQCKETSDLTIVSIFVNPRQFNDPEDLKKYPRPIEADLKMLHDSGVDVVFLPDVEDIYPEGDTKQIEFDPGPSAETMEGKFRPGHFIGMAEVVYRLLSIVTPGQLYMGQKDFQQFAIIRKLIADFRLPIELVMCPTIREVNGLAMSSRNVRLSASARNKAGIIYKNLMDAQKAFETDVPIPKIQETFFNNLSKENFEPEYLEIVDGYSLQVVSNLKDAKQIVACCAVKVEGVRLIDNLIWKEV